MEVTNPSSFGTTTFGEPTVEEMPFPGNSLRRLTVTCAHGEWRPPEGLAQFLPENFKIPIDCYTGPDGLRRIVPRCNFEELIDLGAMGGLAVIHRVRGFNKEVDRSYREMLLIHQHVRGRTCRGTHGMKEHLTREFEYSRDLYIRRLGRESDAERDVLPDDIGMAASGAGSRWSVTRLMQCGRELAQDAGHRNPASKQAIEFGLYEAASRNPLDVAADEAAGLVQTALFDRGGSTGAPSPQVLETVTSRLLEAINSHLDDEREAFDAWFCGPSNSLVKQIAQQKSGPGRLPREDVRQALLYLGWQAYTYVGQCVHALMRTIKNSIPEPLNEEERCLFEQMHESQPYYGGLPLAMLAERTAFLKRAALAIWNEPGNSEHIRVLHRVLNYYGEMMSKRRQADRQSKQHTPGETIEISRQDQAAHDARKHDQDTCEDSSRVEVRDSAAGVCRGGQGELVEDLHFSRVSKQSPFSEVAEHIRQLDGIECAAGCVHWEYHRHGEFKESVTIELRCECGQVQRIVKLSVQEFTERVQEILGWEIPDNPSAQDAEPGDDG
jgi:hypothetical protein